MINSGVHQCYSNPEVCNFNRCTALPITRKSRISSLHCEKFYFQLYGFLISAALGTGEENGHSCNG